MGVTLFLLFVAALAVSLAFCLGAAYHLLRADVMDAAYFGKLKANYRANAPQRPGADVRLSVIYRARPRCLAICDQLACLAALVRGAFPNDCPFEIVCVVGPDDDAALPEVRAAIHEWDFVVPARCETRGIRWLLNGFALSHGAVVADARFLAESLDYVKLCLAESAVVFAEPVFPPPRAPQRKFAIPIMFSREAGDAIFSSLHFLTYGWAQEIQMIVRKLRLKIHSVKARFGKPDYSWIDVFIASCFSAVVRRCIALRFWRYSQRNGCCESVLKTWD
jgi:hypothetical protein